MMNKHWSSYQAAVFFAATTSFITGILGSAFNSGIREPAESVGST
jgi:hypothetical protein